MTQLSSGSRVDFVLVTALPEERDAVLEKLPGFRQLPPVQDDIRTYYQVDLPITFPDNTTGQYRVIVICLLGMGRLQAATATADAIRLWRPRYILLIGIAGGIAARNIQIGDILISDQVVDYELQKLTPQGPEVRWEVQRADPRLLNACNNYRNVNWREAIQIRRPGKGKPKRHTGPIASGDKVVAFGEVLARYRDVWPKLIGVEMEAAGVATAAFQSSDRPGFFMVRGVSDLADEYKGSADVEKWRAYACNVAAAFAIAFLKSGPVPLLETPSRDSVQGRGIVEITDKSARIRRSLLYNVPEIPLNFIHRVEEELLQNALLDNERKIGLHGMAGIGKTALAISVVRSDNIKSRFADGIIWLYFGQNPDLVARQVQSVEFLEKREFGFKDVQHGRAVLGRLTDYKSCLLILDDVWAVDHAAAFDSLGVDSKLLVTTRDVSVIYGLGAKPIAIRELSYQKSLELMTLWLGLDLENLPPQALEVVEACKGLPLAISAVGALQQRNPGSWKRILHRLQTNNLEKIPIQLPGYPFFDLSQSFQASINSLPNEIRDRYLELAILPQGVSIPESAILSFWHQLGINDFDGLDILDTLVHHSLIERDIAGQFTIHNLFASFLRNTTGVQPFEDELKSMGVDEYAKRFLVVHLIYAGENERLGRILHRIYLRNKDNLSRRLSK